MESVARNVMVLHPSPTLVLIDLSEIESIQNAHVGLLWLRYMEAHALGWKLAFVRTPDHLQELIRHCGLEESLPTFGSETHAIRSFNSNLQARSARVAS
jgi:anti-anti-sigma regulatory factor